MPRAIAYLRVSSDQQAESGLGLEAQEAAALVAAKRLGLTLAGCHTDAAVSGASPVEDRPGLLAAIESLCRGDVLLVAKRDRLGRDVVNVALIERLVERKGARVVSCAGEGTDSNDPAGLLMRRLIDSFAEYERALIAARTKAALRAKRARGERAGNLPRGYSLADDGRRLVPNTDEQRIVETTRELRAQGLTLRAIAAELNQRGFRTRAGAEWRHQYVAAITGRAA